MAYSIEVLGAPFDEVQRFRLMDALCSGLKISDSTASLLASSKPCIIQGLESLETLDQITHTLTTSGFKVRLPSASSSGTYDSVEDHIYDDVHFRDYYKLLGISTNATYDEVKKAYYQKSIEFHPDKFQNSPRLSFYIEIQKALNEAYRILSSEARRHEYDVAYQSYTSRSNGNPQSRRAQEEYAIALGFLREGSIAQSIEALRKCIFLNPLL